MDRLGHGADDVALDADGRPVFVSTLFSCLATTSDRYNFEPLWRPPFISKLAAEDRCHLNGLAMRDGRPRYVTACSQTDIVDGWRDCRADGGCVIDVESGEVIADGLSMPHSPRSGKPDHGVLVDKCQAARIAGTESNTLETA